MKHHDEIEERRKELKVEFEKSFYVGMGLCCVCWLLIFFVIHLDIAGVI